MDVDVTSSIMCATLLHGTGRSFHRYSESLASSPLPASYRCGCDVRRHMCALLQPASRFIDIALSVLLTQIQECLASSPPPASYQCGQRDVWCHVHYSAVVVPEVCFIDIALSVFLTPFLPASLCVIAFTIHVSVLLPYYHVSYYSA